MNPISRLFVSLCFASLCLAPLQPISAQPESSHRRLKSDVVRQLDRATAEIQREKVRWQRNFDGKLKDRRGQPLPAAHVLRDIAAAENSITGGRRSLDKAWQQLVEETIDQRRFEFLADQTYEQVALAVWTMHQRAAKRSVDLIQQDYDKVLSVIRKTWTDAIVQATGQNPGAIRGIRSALAANEQATRDGFARRYRIAARRLEMVRRRIKSEFESWAAAAKQAKRLAAPEQFSNAIKTHLESGFNGRNHGVPSHFDRYLRQNDVLLPTAVSGKSIKLSMVEIFDDLIGQELLSEFPPNEFPEIQVNPAQIVGSQIISRPWATYEGAPQLISTHGNETNYMLYVCGWNLDANQIAPVNPRQTGLLNYRIKYFGKKGKPPVDDDLFWYWNEGQHAITKGMSATNREMVRKMDAVIVHAFVPEGATPGFKEFRISDAKGNWYLPDGTTYGSIRFVRPLGGGTFQTPREFFQREVFQIQIVARRPLDVDSIEVVLTRNNEHLPIGSKRWVICKAINPGRAPTEYGTRKQIFRSAPIFIGAASQAGSQSAGTFCQALDPSDELVATTRKRVFLQPVMTKAKILDKPTKWRQAVLRAALLSGRNIPRKHWRELIDVERKTITRWLVVPNWNRILPKRLTAKVTVGHHAAMLLLREEFIESSRKHLADLKKIRQDEKLIWGWYHSMRPVMQMATAPGGGQLFPLSQVQVTSPTEVGIHRKKTVPLSHAWSDALVGREFGNASTAAKDNAASKWVLSCTKQAIDLQIIDLESAIRHVEKISERDLDGLLELTGNDFAPISNVVAERTMKMTPENPASGSSVRWRCVPDVKARIVVRDVANLFYLLKLQKKAADADTKSVLAFATALGLSGASFTTYEVLSNSVLMATSIGSVTEATRDILRYRKNEIAIRFATDSLPVLGRDRLKANLKLRSISGDPYLTFFLSAVGMKFDVTGLTRAVSLKNATENAARLLTKIEDRGTAAIGRMSQSDASQVALLLEESRQLDALGKPLTATQQAFKNLADDLAEQAAGGSQWVRPKLNVPSDTTVGPVGSSVTRRGLEEGMQPLPMKEQASLVLNRGAANQVVYAWGNRFGHGFYAVAYRMVDPKTGARTGEAIKFLRNKVTRKFPIDDSTAKQVLNRTEAGWNLIKNHDDVLKAECKQFVSRVEDGNQVNFYTQQLIDLSNPAKLKLIDGSDLADAEVVGAVLGLFKKLASKDLIWADPNLGNIFLKRVDNTWVAGILDPDMIVHLNRPIGNHYLAHRIRDIELGAFHKYGIDSLGEQAANSRLLGEISSSNVPMWRSADDYFRKMLESYGMVRYNPATNSFKDGLIKVSDVDGVFDLHKAVDFKSASRASRRPGSTSTTANDPKLSPPVGTSHPARGPPKSSTTTPPTKPGPSKPGSGKPGSALSKSAKSSGARTAADSAELATGADKARNSIARGHKDSNGVWNQGFLNKPKNSELKQLLDEFEKGTVGASVKNLDVSNRSAQQLNDELAKAGFKRHREPLKAGKDSVGNQLYRKKDGTKTASPNDPEIVPHDIYTHADGGMVRVKPAGDPGSRFRPQPHVSKSVLQDPSNGTGFANEGFKVTNKGQAVPKSPNKSSGMKQTPNGSKSKNENAGFVDETMAQAHTNLPPRK